MPDNQFICQTHKSWHVNIDYIEGLEHRPHLASDVLIIRGGFEALLSPSRKKEILKKIISVMHQT
jgi:DNA-binding LytR/AlgR family response regulator